VPTNEVLVADGPVDVLVDVASGSIDAAIKSHMVARSCRIRLVSAVYCHLLAQPY